MPLNDSVPSAAFDVLQRNAQDLDKVVNQDTGTVTNRTGDNLTPLPVITKQASDLLAKINTDAINALSSAGYFTVGDFGTVFTINSRADVGFDTTTKQAWRWSGALPKTVLAGDTPSAPDWTNITDATLRSDLAATNSLVPIAGVSASDLALAGVGIGQALINQINSQQGDVNILAMGDSTGDEAYEWVYRLGLYLGSKYPTHTVSYRLWSAGGDNYSSASNISSGASGNTINIYNASVSGSTCVYFLGQRFNKVFANKKMDLIIHNYGHNQGTDSTLELIQQRLTEYVAQVIAAQPLAEFVLTLQNEDLDFLSFSARQAKITHTVASLFGLPCLDVRSAFLHKRLTGNIMDWMGDVVHPNSAGHEQWVKLIIRALENPRKHSGARLNPLACKEFNPIFNAHFYDWVWTNELPSGFYKNGSVSVSKESVINETLSWSLKAVNQSASLGEIRFDLGSVLSDRAKGVDLMLSVRMHVPSGATVNSGRIEVASNIGSAQTAPYNEVYDGWTWRLLKIPAVILDGAETLTGSVYIGSATGDTVYIDRISLVGGELPKDTYFTTLPILEYYFPDNVKPIAGAALVVTGNTVQVTGTPAPFAEFAVNLFGLTVGSSYTLVWDSQNAIGSVAVYVAPSRSGAVLVSADISTDTLTWVATASNNSVVFNASTGTKTLHVSDLSITQN
jgi:hypothetical protein